MPVLLREYSGIFVRPVLGAGYDCVGPLINPVVADQKERSPVPKLMFVGQVCNWEKPVAAKNIAAKLSKYFFIQVLIGATKNSSILICTTIILYWLVLCSLNNGLTGCGRTPWIKKQGLKGYQSM